MIESYSIAYNTNDVTNDLISGVTEWSFIMAQSESRAEFRRKRVRIIKRVIMGTIVAAIVIPVVTCIILAVRVSQLERELESLKTELGSVTGNQKPNKGGNQEESREQGENESSSPSHEGETPGSEESTKDSSEESTEESTVAQRETQPKGNNGAKKVYLTFDDGPSANTDRILDILKQYNVKATFFVIYHGGEDNAQRYKRIIEEGHTLAVHSFSHDYKVVYSNLAAFIQDVTDIRNYVYGLTGYMPTVYRFPGGSSNSYFKQDVTLAQCIEWLHGNGMEYFDWNVSSQDAVTPVLSVEEIMANIMEGNNSVLAHDYSIVLMHDEAHKSTTVEALPGLIEKLQSLGCEILPITQDTPAVHHRE